MASLLLKGVHKRLGLPSISSISCSSADATSVVATTGPGTGTGSSRFIDRHSPRLRDPHRNSSTKPPRPPSFTASDSSTSNCNSNANQQQQHGHGHDSKKKKKKKSGSTDGGGRRASSSEKKQLVSPATSSRFLLNSSRMQSDDLAVDDVLALPPTSFIDVHFSGDDAPVHFPDEKQAMQLAESSSSGSGSGSGSGTSSSSASSSSEITPAVDSSSRDQEEVLKRSCSTRSTQAGQVVVMLRVSLHCKGCAGKVKKHIAKMEGVTSFDIDIATKKVTVVGDVTPLGVLNSVSKVKAAQFWPTHPSSTPTSTPTPTPPRASASF